MMYTTVSLSMIGAELSDQRKIANQRRALGVLETGRFG